LTARTSIRFWACLYCGNYPAVDAPAVKGFGLRFSTSVPDTNFMFWRNGDGGAGTFTNTGIAIDGNVHTLMLRADGTNVYLDLDGVAVNYNDGPTGVGVTEGMRPAVELSTLVNEARDFGFYSAYMESDK